MGERFLIVKLGALGDVLRTTPVLQRLRQEHPDAHVTWITAPEAAPLLADIPTIDRVLTWDLQAVLRLQVESFDHVISLDKTMEAAALAGQVDAVRRSGFGLDAVGAIVPLDPASDYAVRLGLDDELKFRVNRKTYQQVTFEQLGWEFEGEPYALPLRDEHRGWAETRLAELGAGDGIVGLAVGAGAVFAHKTWPPERWSAFADAIRRQLGRPVLVMIGPGERDLGAAMMAGATPAGPGLWLSGGDHDLRQFAALVERCDAIVCGDTLATLIAIGVETPVVAVFGPTCAPEIEFYGRGKAVVTTLDCAPCYRRTCEESPTCTEAIGQDEVLVALRELLR